MIYAVSLLTLHPKVFCSFDFLIFIPKLCFSLHIRHTWLPLFYLLMGVEGEMVVAI
jgi:hypothetical protein